VSPAPASAVTSVFVGAHVVEIRQVFNTWVTQIIRLYKDAAYVELVPSVGPIFIGDGVGKEVIMVFNSSIQTNNTWYTDAGGLEMKQRILNYRATWDFQVTEPISGNYAPVNHAIYIEDANTRLTVLPSKSEGGVSLRNGELELMLHRRLLVDDNRGVGEPLNESTTTTVPHILFVSSPQSAARRQRPLSHMLNHQLILAYGEPTPLSIVTKAVASRGSSQNNSFVPLAYRLPTNVHVVTLRTLPSGKIVLQLQHIYSYGEDPVLALPVAVDVSALFVDLHFSAVVDMDASANQPYSAISRLVWRTATPNPPVYPRMPLDGFVVTLRPMELRTLLLTLA